MHKRHSILLKTLRLLLGVGLLAVLVARLDPAEFKRLLLETRSHPWWMLAGVAATFAGLVSGVVRWHRLLGAQRFGLPLGQTFQITFIGQFFNAFMPGSCGGDVVRGYYAARNTPKGNRTEVATTVIADRLIGLFTLMAFCAVLIISRLNFFFQQSETRIAGILMVLFLAGALGGSLVFFRKHRFEQWRLFRWAEARFHFGPLLRRAYDALFLYRNRPAILFEAMLYSLFNMVFLTLACLCFGQALELPVSAYDYFTLFPIITVLASVPLTPGALGLREGLFVVMFGAVGVGDAAAISLSLLVYLGGVACSLFGGLVFLQYSSSHDSSFREEWRELKRDHSGS